LEGAKAEAGALARQRDDALQQTELAEGRAVASRKHQEGAVRELLAAQEQLSTAQQERSLVQEQLSGAVAGSGALQRIKGFGSEISISGVVFRCNFESTKEKGWLTVLAVYLLARDFVGVPRCR